MNDKLAKKLRRATLQTINRGIPPEQHLTLRMNMYRILQVPSKRGRVMIDPDGKRFLDPSALRAILKPGCPRELYHKAKHEYRTRLHRQS